MIVLELVEECEFLLCVAAFKQVLRMHVCANLTILGEDFLIVGVLTYRSLGRTVVERDLFYAIHYDDWQNMCSSREVIIWSIQVHIF